jgi:hypothetical protein
VLVKENVLLTAFGDKMPSALIITKMVNQGCPGQCSADISAAHDA